MDLLGIVIVTIGKIASGIHYVFVYEPYLQELYCKIVSPFQKEVCLHVNLADSIAQTLAIGAHVELS